MAATDRTERRRRGPRLIARAFASGALALALAAPPGAAHVALAAPEPAADLTVGIGSAADDGGPPRAGEYYTYTLTVRNLGAAAAAGVTVRHVLPIISLGTAIFVPMEQEGFTCRLAEEPGPSAAVTCAGGIIPADGVAVLRFQAAFSEGDPRDAVLRAFGDDPDEPLLVATAATVDPDDAIAESDEGNNTAREWTALGPPPAPGRAAPAD